MPSIQYGTTVIDYEITYKEGKKDDFLDVDFADMDRDDQKTMIANLEDQMRSAAKKLDFEQAANLRDTVLELKAQIE